MSGVCWSCPLSVGRASWWHSLICSALHYHSVPFNSMGFSLLFPWLPGHDLFLAFYIVSALLHLNLSFLCLILNHDFLWALLLAFSSYCTWKMSSSPIALSDTSVNITLRSTFPVLTFSWPQKPYFQHSARHHQICVPNCLTTAHPFPELLSGQPHCI